MEEQFELEKWVWTSSDFARMGWHDCLIYAIRFDGEVRLDIDYIFKWINNGPGKSFTFWIAPATLIFAQASYLKINTEVDFVNGLEIADIIREETEGGTVMWTIATQQGDILIKANDYKQVIRRPPSFQYSLYIPTEERGGISFSEIAEKDYSDSADILAKRAERTIFYNLKNEKSDLISKREVLDKTVLGAKTYLEEKQQIDQKILEIDQALLQAPG